MSQKTSRTKLLLWFGSVIGILLLVIASLAIYISTRSDEWWRDILSTQLSKTLERKAEFKGKFHLDIGRIITFEVSSVRISNPAWSESPDMLRIGSLLLVFDPLSFLGDALLIKRLELADIELELVENRDGNKNWTFGAEPAPLSEAPSTLKLAKNLALPVRIEKLSLQHARISLMQPTRKQPTVLQVDAITGNTTSAGTGVLNGSGQLDDLPVSLNVMLEPSETGFDLQPSKLVVGGNKLAVEGHMVKEDRFRAELNVTGEGPDLSVFTRLANTIQFPAWPFQVEGTVEINNNQLVVTVKHARLGPTETVATLKIPDLNAPTSLMVDVREVKTTDISAALSLVGVELNLPEAMPANFDGQIERAKHATRLSRIRGAIGESNIQIDGMIGDPPKFDSTRITLDISGSDLAQFLPHPIKQTIPFQVNGVISRDTRYTQFENMQLKLADLEAKVHGKVGNWENMEGTDLVISAQAPNTDILAAILNSSIPAGAVEFDGHVKTTGDAFHIDRMNAQLGPNNLSGDLKLIQGKPPLLKGRLNSNYLDLAMLHKAEPGMGPKAKTENTSNSDKTEAGKNTTPRKQQSLLFTDTPIKLDALDHIDLDLAIQIDEVTNSLKALGSLYDVSAKVLLKGRDLSVADLEVLGARGGTVKGNLAMRGETELTHIDVNIAGKEIRLGLAAAPGQDPATYPPTEMKVKFNGAGRTYHSLATSLNGRIKVVQGKGLINNSQAVNMFSDTFSELFHTLNPFAKTEPTTTLNCSVFLINLANGQAEVQDIVLQTDKLTIVSAGTIDLNKEHININFETRPREGLGISTGTITNPYIKLGGSLRKPMIELNPKRAIITTGAAVATGGLWFLYKGIWDRYFSTPDPCGEVLKRDAELKEEADPKP